MAVRACTMSACSSSGYSGDEPRSTQMPVPALRQLAPRTYQWPFAQRPFLRTAAFCGARTMSCRQKSRVRARRARQQRAQEKDQRQLGRRHCRSWGTSSTRSTATACLLGCLPRMRLSLAVLEEMSVQSCTPRMTHAVVRSAPNQALIRGTGAGIARCSRHAVRRNELRPKPPIVPILRYLRA